MKEYTIKTKNKPVLIKSLDSAEIEQVYSGADFVTFRLAGMNELLTFVSDSAAVIPTFIPHFNLPYIIENNSSRVYGYSSTDSKNSKNTGYVISSHRIGSATMVKVRIDKSEFAFMLTEVTIVAGLNNALDETRKSLGILIESVSNQVSLTGIEIAKLTMMTTQLKETADAITKHVEETAYNLTFNEAIVALNEAQSRTRHGLVDQFPYIIGKSGVQIRRSSSRCNELVYRNNFTKDECVSNIRRGDYVRLTSTTLNDMYRLVTND